MHQPAEAVPHIHSATEQSEAYRDLDEECIDTALENWRETEFQTTQRLFQSENRQGVDAHDWESDKCVFSHCALLDSDFSKVTFSEVEFLDCDFSNTDFSGGFFKSCRFTRCKGVGANFLQAVFKQTIFEDCLLMNAYFDESNMVEVRFLRSDCTEASFSQMDVDRLVLDESKFIHNDLFKTPLKDIDFSKCAFSDPIVSMPPIELEGVHVDAFQAAGLARLMGVIVEA